MIDGAKPLRARVCAPTGVRPDIDRLAADVLARRGECAWCRAEIWVMEGAIVDSEKAAVELAGLMTEGPIESICVPCYRRVGSPGLQDILTKGYSTTTSPTHGSHS